MTPNHLREIKARTDVACSNGFTSQQFDDLKTLIAEIERLTAENATGKEANESCLQYIESLKKRVATLEKALQETRLTLSAIYGTSGKFADETILRYWQAQAQEQEGVK